MMRAVEAHSCGRRSPTDRCGPPLFRALDALTVDDRGGRAGLSLGQLPTPDVKRVMDAIQRAVVVPAAEGVVHRAAGRQVLRQRCPLAAVLRIYISPLTISGSTTVRLLPPRLAGGISGAMIAHSASARSLGYRSL